MRSSQRHCELGLSRTAWVHRFSIFQSPDAWAALGKSGQVRPFVYAFLAGIGIQVFSALLYKTVMWYLYMEELQDVPATHWKVKVSAYLSSAYWLEMGMDLATIGCFGVATVRALMAVVQ